MGRRPSIHDTGGNHLQRSSTQSRTRRGSGLDDINRMTYSYTTLWDVTSRPAPTSGSSSSPVAPATPRGTAKGRAYIGQITEATDGNGNLAFMSTFPVAVPVGRFITATATDPAGNTSEFSLCVQVTEASPGDVNGDGKVNSEDLRLIAANLGTRPPDDPRADVDGDGMVDARDLAAVAISFGRPGPAPVADGIIDGNDPALPASNQGKVESPYQVR